MTPTCKEAMVQGRARLARLQEQAIARYRVRQSAWDAAIAMPNSTERHLALRSVPPRHIGWGDFAVKAELISGRAGATPSDYRFHYLLREKHLPAKRALAALADGEAGVVELPARKPSAPVALVAEGHVIPFPRQRREQPPTPTFREDLEGLVASKSEADCAVCPLVGMLRRVLRETQGGAG